MTDNAHTAPTPSLRDAIVSAIDNAPGNYPAWKADDTKDKIRGRQSDAVMALLIDRGIICEHGETKPHRYEISMRLGPWLEDCSGPALPKEARS